MQSIWALVSELGFLHVSHLLAPKRATFFFHSLREYSLESPDVGSKFCKHVGKSFAKSLADHLQYVLVYKAEIC